MDLPIPTSEHLLVYYLPDQKELEKVTKRLDEMSYERAKPENPYWSRGGVTFKDPDGWLVVLMNHSRDMTNQS